MSESFVFYASFHEATQDLNDEQYGKVMRALNNYALNAIEPNTDDAIVNMVFKLVKPQIDANTKRRENSVKGGAPKGNNNASKEQTTVEKEENKKQPMVDFLETEKQPNVNVNVNDNVNGDGNVNVAQVPENSTTSPPFDSKINKDYVKVLYVEWKDTGQVCPDEITFLQREMQEARLYLNGYHSEDVLQAIRNYRDILPRTDVWHGWKNTTTFNQWAKKHLYRFIPGTFDINQFLDGNAKQVTSPPSYDHLLAAAEAQT